MLLHPLGVGVEGAVTCFASADNLREALEPGPDAFDLFLLDIRMEGTSGLDLARWLYRQGVRERFIFVTGAAEYAVEGYRTHPLHYLLKPVERLPVSRAFYRSFQSDLVRYVNRSGGR